MHVFRPTASARGAASGELIAAPNNKDEVIHDVIVAHSPTLKFWAFIAIAKLGIMRIPFKTATSNPTRTPAKLVRIVVTIKYGLCRKHSSAVGFIP